MASIRIQRDGPNSGGVFSSANAAAYAALDSLTLNTVTVEAGVIPFEAGLWWGRSNGCEKPIEWVVDGSASAEVVFDGRWFLSESTPYTAVGGNVYRYELFTDASATLTTFYDAWFGAQTGAAVSDIALGTIYRPAASLGQVGSAGLTRAGMLAGNGVWFQTTEASIYGPYTACVFYVWAPASGNPVTQWDGIAMGFRTSAPSVAGSPRWTPFVLGRTGAGADPSGTIVNPGFTVIGAGQSLLGTSSGSMSSVTKSIIDVVYDSVKMYGPAPLAALWVATETLSEPLSFRLEGGWLFDQVKRPDTCPLGGSTGAMGGLLLGSGSQGCEVRDGAMTFADTHGAVQLSVASTLSASLDGSGCSVDGVACRVADNSDYSRQIGVANHTGGRVSNCTFEGFGVRSQIGGINTLISFNTFSRQSYSPYNNTDGKSYHQVVQFRTSGDRDWTLCSVRAYNNVVDRRGDEERGNPEPWRAFELRAVEYVPSSVYGRIPANFLDARHNVSLGDVGTCALALSIEGTGAIDPDQTWIGGFSNITECVTGATDDVYGTASTYAAAFSTGDTTTQANLLLTADQIETRGDRPTPHAAPPELGGL